MARVIHPRAFAIRGRNINHSTLLQFAASHVHHHHAANPQLVNLDLANAFDHTSVFHLVSTFLLIFGCNVTSRLLFFILFRRCLLLKVSSSLSSPIFMVNGILQGCPLSSSLFSIYLDPLLHSLDRKVIGLSLPPSSFCIKSLAFVDDLVVGCRDQADVLSAFRTVRDFQMRTGSPINMRKTFVFHLVKPHSTRDVSFSVRNSTKVLAQKSLGHFLLPSQGPQREAQRQSFLTHAHTFFRLHKHRSLSCGARVRVINSLIISRFVYHAVFLHFPASWFLHFNRLIRSFIWDSIPYVSLEKLYLPRKFGGLGLINVKLLFILLRLRFSSSILSVFSYNPPFALFLQDLYNRFFHISSYSFAACADLTGTILGDLSSFQYGTFVRLMCQRSALLSIPPRYLNVFKNLFLSPGQSNFMYSLLHKCLPLSTYLVSVKKMFNVSPVCIFCSKELETFSHLFFRCHVVWPQISLFLNGFKLPFSSFKSILTSTAWSGISLRQLKLGIVLAFSVWKARCALVFATHAEDAYDIQHFFFLSRNFDYLYLPAGVLRTLW